MKRFAVLGTKPGWHCERTIAAFKRRGAEAEFVTVETLVAPLGLPEAKAPLAEYDGLLIRGIPGGSLEQVIYRMDALHVLERGGLKCVNPPKTIEKTVDKFLTLNRPVCRFLQRFAARTGRLHRPLFLCWVKTWYTSRSLVPAATDCSG
jgi:glutathione synthase/RimK-type ligase-like ATP-grasp enzyme